MGKKYDKEYPPVDSSQDKKSNLVCSVPVLRNVFTACAEPAKEKSVVNVIDAAEKNGLSGPGAAAGAERNKAALDQVMKGIDGP